ncbi:exported hypothetical protein [uncultured Desulfobacterium sp.]|uniref:Lipid/polyisoprenoid-binding YceI-like domain-containing protein n=1 Tax=uncultured Desulfobacterium sp. TaxID=201089 RepID=A0A445MVZ5_9BACT|nr:exported hypothetical protein [uncultured Desulfobacterium sp.]
MKRNFTVILGALFLLAVSSAQSMSATLEDVADSYIVQITAKAKVKKLGSEKTHSAGLLVLTSGGTFSLDDYNTPNDVSGIIYLDSKGKKILFELTPAGQSSLEKTMLNWLETAAASKGINLEDTGINVLSVKTSKVKIDKKTNKPKGTAKYTAKGTVYGDIVGQGHVTAKFSYQAKIKFPSN